MLVTSQEIIIIKKNGSLYITHLNINYSFEQNIAERLFLTNKKGKITSLNVVDYCIPQGDID